MERRMNILIDGQTFMSEEIDRGIGVYLKNVLNNIVKCGFYHKWYIITGNKNAICCLDPWVQTRVIVLENTLFSSNISYDNSSQYTDILNEIIIKEKIDVYWNPNPLMVNVLFPDKVIFCKTFCTIHDLIPAIIPIQQWSDNIKIEYWRRIKYLKNNECTLLCVSKATRQDVYKYIGKSAKCVITLLAADHKLFYKKCYRNGLNDNPVLLFTGGFDYRKNIEGAIKAFGLLKKKYSDEKYVRRLKFYIVCKLSIESKKELLDRLKDSNISDDIVFTGFVPDQILADLYRYADILFFPSLYEGFGLPILEAMLAGCYVVSSNTSSMPEICDGKALLCSPSDIDDMAEKLKESIDIVKEEKNIQKQERQEYALRFSWVKTALTTLEAMEQQDFQVEKTANIAIVTPWPNQKTGIANYVYSIVPYLRDYFKRVDVFTDKYIIERNELKGNPAGNLYDISELDELRGKYDEIIYQIGNNTEFHKNIYESLLKHKGIAEIHDYVLHPFFYEAFFKKNKKYIYQDALEKGYGEEGLNHFIEVNNQSAAPDIFKYPMNEGVVANSKSVIFHNIWSKNNCQADPTKIHIIPHPCFPKSDYEQLKKKTSINLEKVFEEISSSKDLIVIGCFGFVNHNKRPEVVMQAHKELLDKGYNVKLCFWGKSNIDNLSVESGTVFVSGYLDEYNYHRALSLSDIIVNLRYPSMGEASGTLCEAMIEGKPVIVSDHNQYSEYPDDVCWKVPINNKEVETLVVMLEYLITHPEVREALGNNAKWFATTILDPQKIAFEYYKVITKVKNG